DVDRREGLHHGREEGRLARVDAVEAGPGDARLGGQLIHRKPRQAVAGQQLAGGFEDPAANVRLRLQLELAEQLEAGAEGAVEGRPRHSRARYDVRHDRELTLPKP